MQLGYAFHDYTPLCNRTNLPFKPHTPLFNKTLDGDVRLEGTLNKIPSKPILNSKVILVLFVIAMITLVCSPGSWCGSGGYIADQARQWDIENYRDAIMYWPTLRNVQWSADGSHIVFVLYARDEQESRIYAVASDGSDLELIVEDGYQPNISPDSERVVYTATEVHRKIPFLFETRKIDGSGRHRFTEGGGEPNYLYPAWSPDGTRIAFARYSESGEFLEDSGIFSMAANGSDLRWHLRSFSLYGAGPVWSPDGKNLAFTVGGGTLRVLYDIEEVGSKLTTVYESPIREKYEYVNEIMGHPAWSPDGRKLAFVLNVHPGDSAADPPEVHVVTINADGSDLRKVAELTRKIVSGVNLSWSPDGDDILFTLSSNEVFVANADGNGYEKVGRGYYATWSPEGSRIAVLGSAEPDTIIYTMAPDGSDVQILVRKDEDGNLQAANK